MNTSSFSLENNNLIYEEKQITYTIQMKENEQVQDTINLYIRANKKGIRAKKTSKQLETFLRNHFFDIKNIRLRYLMHKPQIRKIVNEVKKSEYQYYYVEMVSCIALILSLVLYGFHKTEPSGIFLVFGILVNIITVFISIGVLIAQHINFQLIGRIPTKRLIMKCVSFNLLVLGPIYFHPLI